MSTTRVSRSFFCRAGTLLVVLGLCAAAAVAAVQTANVPEGDDYEITAVFVPGPNGGEVMAGGDDFDDDVVLSIRFDPDGVITVNGAPIGSADPEESYTVSTRCFLGGNGWLADTTVTHTSSGGVVATDMARPIGADKAATITVTAETITSLTVE